MSAAPAKPAGPEKIKVVVVEDQPQILKNQLKILGESQEIEVIGAVSASPDDFEAAAGLLAAGPGIAKIITRRVPLDGLADAFERLVSSPADGKVVVEPNAGA